MYVQGDGYEAVELPYAKDDKRSRGDASMIVVLPAEGQWQSFTSKLDGALYGQIAGSLSTAPPIATVKLPKFKIDDPPLGLNDPLSALGMADVFEDKVADFSGMTQGEQLHIDGVLHKAVISVDETGTEAAAATGVGAGATSVPQPKADFNANRPFLIFIRDVPTGALLFAGQVTDPG